MLALAGIEAGFCLEALAAGLTALRLGISTYKTLCVSKFDKDINETLTGEFRKVYYLDDKVISSATANQLLYEEAVVCVKRCCSSLTSWFPSGVFSILTWTLAAQAARHEYLVIYTTNYVILIELSPADGQKNAKKGCVTKLIISESKKIDRLKNEKDLTKNKWYTRALATVEGSDLGSLTMDQILRAVDAWILIARGGNQKYSILQKNCKSLARTIRYFAEINVNYKDVMYSALGIFTDKPGKYLVHLDMVLIEKAFFKSATFCSKEMEEVIKDVMRLFEAIRTRNLENFLKISSEP